MGFEGGEKLNQFNNYSEQLKKCSEVYSTAVIFDEILNNIWCTYSFHKGKKQWREFASNVPEPFRFKIDIEICHVELGHGIKQARLAVKDEMEKYIDFLNKKYNFK